MTATTIPATTANAASQYRERNAARLARTRDRRRASNAKRRVTPLDTVALLAELATSQRNEGEAA